MLTILSVEDMKRHFGFWLAILANATPIDPLTLPKSLRRMLDKMNRQAAGKEPDAGTRCSWACRFMGCTEASSDDQTPDTMREFYLCGPDELDQDDAVLILAGDIDPSQVQEWENGIGWKFWKSDGADGKGKAKTVGRKAGAAC